MSKIDKLSILGVRSFDNTRSETIQFYSPLTLVVGFNGSGKTTIIECLKYATTGILPPNSKGGAFIHDPKLAGERQVLAQVKLSFKAATGASMAVTRSLQLTVKKPVNQQKTLESQLVQFEEGERTTKSSRVAELDRMIPHHLGVSTAVIDNVIFCHQDESLWPMSEPSVLKKKFDEIFEAQKYTKAIENIKQLRKKQNEELGKHKIIEQHAKEDKAMAEKTEKRIRKLHDDIEMLREECGRLERQMLEVGELAHDAHQHYNRYDSLSISLKTKQDDATSRKQVMSSLEASMEKLSESDDWLTTTLEQFDSRIEGHGQRKEHLLQAFTDLKAHLHSKQCERGDKLAEKGRIEAEKNQYEKQVQDRQELVKDVARRHNLRPYENVTDHDGFDHFMQKFKKLCRDESHNLTQARQEADSGRRDAQANVNSLDQRQKALQDNKVEARKLVAQNESDSLRIRDSVSRISDDEGSKAVIESHIEDTAKRLRTAETDANNPSRQTTLTEANGKVALLEGDSRNLRERLVQSTRRSDELAELAHLKKLIKDSSRSLETMNGVHGGRIAQLLGSDWQPSTVALTYQDVLAARSRDLESATQDQSVASRELEQCEFKIDTINVDVSQKEKMLQDCRRKVRDAVDDEPPEFLEILQDRQKSVDSMREDAGQMAGLSSFMQQILNIANEKGLCRTCSRPFRNETELTRFKTRMEGLVKKAQSETQDEEIKELETDLQMARDAAKYYESWQQLCKEIPMLKDQKAQLDEEKDKLLSRLEQRDKSLQEQQEAKRDVEALSKTVQSISKHDAEVRINETRIDQLSSKQSHSETSLTVDEIQDQMEEIEKKTTESREVVKRLAREEESSREVISRFRLEISGLQGQLSTSTFQLEKKGSLLIELEKVKAATNKQREAISQADEQIEQLGSDLAKAKESYNEIEERGKARERELQSRVDDVSKNLQDLQYSTRMIEEYLNADGPEQLPRAERQLKALDRDISTAENSQVDLTREIHDLKEQIDKSEAVRRNYSMNLRHRQMSRGLDTVMAEIVDLSNRTSGIDPAQYREEGNRRDREYHVISGQREGKTGEMVSKDNQLAELLADFEADYKGAARKYKEAHIKTETTKAAMEDLARYGSALDRAIMTYHALKMQEINGTIEELWQRTYQGTDVDTIMIRADNENAKGNRNYNYRVSMLKQDVEMDMRGRCSAGQKVLASIIIRLALAECFGVNCGLIALDEPTTNLDRDNIRSLAESLHDIITHRRQQANFQLIVITHDEDFLRHMQCGDFTDYYYRVSRNDRQKSIVERRAITDVL